MPATERSAGAIMFRYVGQIALLLALALALPAMAQQALGGGDPYPLRPPDTSSPRDTLQTFLEHADYAIKAWQEGRMDTRGFRNLVNTLEAMDFSATPGREAFWVQIERVILLKELLDRLPLPPAGQIPGDSDVASGEVRKWTVPDTRITIARIEDGARAGEFVFSAETVERLDSFYRLAKHLPYKPSATTPGIYEAFRTVSATVPVEAQLQSRLRKVDASSPRATLMGFMDSVNEAYVLVLDADARLKADPPRITEEEVRQIEDRARSLLGRALNLLDISQLPEAYRDDAALESVFQLKEVLDRTLLPFPESVPDAQMVAAARKREGRVSGQADEPFRWRYPNTEIEIAEVMKGERRGQFLFAADTVRRAREFFEKVRDLPYRSELGTGASRNYEWTGESKGIYDHYISSPAYVVPQAHLLGRLVDRLPDSFKVLYGNNTLWQWIGLLVSVAATLAAGALVFRLTSRLSGRLNTPLRHWVAVLAPVLAALIVRRALRLVDENINITGLALHLMVALAEAAIAILTVWAIMRLMRAIAETLITSPRIREGSHDASLVRITARIVAFLAGSLIVIYSLRHLGADMVPLLAGLGVGGLAIALAAQRTFANFIGSLILFVNKPVRVGDFCRYGDHVGTVEHIGLLATRIRSLERTIVTVPNAEFSEMKIDNFAVRDQRLLKTVLQLRYETSSEQLRYILAKLRELLLGHPKVTPSPARVRFVGYGAFSKDLEVFAYLDCADQDTFLAIQEDILLRMERIVEDGGSGFAFPSQTAYLARDKGVDTGRRRAAESTVERWRGRGVLPFPEFDDQQRRRRENVLDYPPEGSPDYVAPKVARSGLSEEEFLQFTSDDLPDIPAFVARLRTKHRLMEHIQDRLSERTLELLQKYGGGRDEELKEGLVRDLNAILTGPSIYNERLFAEVRLREETEEFLAREPEAEELGRLNRLLLEDAFAGVFMSRKESV